MSLWVSIGSLKMVDFQLPFLASRRQIDPKKGRSLNLFESWRMRLALRIGEMVKLVWSSRMSSTLELMRQIVLNKCIMFVGWIWNELKTPPQDPPLLSETFCQYLFSSWAQNSWKSFSVESKANRRVILPSFDFLLDSHASVSLAFISFLIRAGKSKSDEIKFLIVASSVAVRLQFTLRSVFDPRLFCQVFFVGRFNLHVSFSLVFLGFDFNFYLGFTFLRFSCYFDMGST